MSAGRLPQNLLILLYKIKNNEVSLNMVTGGGGWKTTHIAYYPLKPLNIKLDKVSCTTYTVPQ